MATSSNLAGLGMAPGLANLLGLNPTLITCAGTNAGGATTITGTLCNLSTGGSATGAILPAVGTGLGALGQIVVVNCTTATTAVVYPPTGATINGGSSLSVAQNKTAIFYYYSTTIIFSVLTA